MTPLPPDFSEFLRLLQDRDVRYLLVGGYAVAHYAEPRATGAMDIWIAVDKCNAERVVAVLKEFGFGTSKLSAQIFRKPDQLVRMGVPPLRIEIMTSISGVEFEACYARRTTIKIEGVSIDLISLDDLRANKRASGRHQDLDDLERLGPAASSPQ